MKFCSILAAILIFFSITSFAQNPSAIVVRSDYAGGTMRNEQLFNNDTCPRGQPYEGRVYQNQNNELRERWWTSSADQTKRVYFRPQNRSYYISDGRAGHEVTDSAELLVVEAERLRLDRAYATRLVGRSCASTGNSATSTPLPQIATEQSSCTRWCRTMRGDRCCLYARYGRDENCYENGNQPQTSCLQEATVTVPNSKVRPRVINESTIQEAPSEKPQGAASAE